MKIADLNQIVSHIKNQNGFIFGNRDGYKFIDCTSKEKHHIDYPIRHECRGIKFSPEGTTIARPLHKFFKIQTTDTKLENIFASQTPYEVTEKISGVMIHGAMIYNAIVFMSRRGRTQIAVEAEQFLTDKVASECRNLLVSGYTPIFLYSSPKINKTHTTKHSKLTLIAIRNTIEGDYLNLDETQKNAEKMKLPSLRKVSKNWKSTTDFISFIKHLKNNEGLVIRFKNNLWLEIHCPNELEKRCIKNGIETEKDILSLVLNDRLEFILPHLTVSERRDIEKYKNAFQNGIRNATRQINQIIEREKHKKIPLPNMQREDISPLIRSLAVSIQTGRYNCPKEAIHSVLVEQTKNNLDIDTVRDLFNAKWH